MTLRSKRAWAAHGLYPPHFVVDEHTISTKAGEPFCALRFTGPDSECLEPAARESARAAVMSAMQTLPSEVELLTWLVRTPTSELPQPLIANKTADSLLAARRQTLSKRNLSDLNTYFFLLQRNQTARYRLRSTSSQLLSRPGEWFQERFSPRKGSQRYFTELKRGTRALRNTREVLLLWVPLQCLL